MSDRFPVALWITRITLETFLAWKKRKLRERKEKAEKDEEKKRSDFKAGRQVGISGREMFSFNPELAVGDGIDDGDEAIDSYAFDDEDSENIEYRELDMERLAMEASELDTNGITIAQADRLKSSGKSSEMNGEASVTVGDGAGALAINENLFTEDDLEGLEEELEDLDMEE
ncbi:hypothetical protein PV327_006245 [Microctonus hyperodae]|uniref:ZC3H15/TMA46 family C-terminal domain-containing protein n=1 Tax=Microctonus hyperodae TaxID=165561 RepID=A0AA39F3X6_MICHY|nr:hypothetical protein PV327_006245 [Microctonus hyperodae]